MPIMTENPIIHALESMLGRGAPNAYDNIGFSKMDHPFALDLLDRYQRTGKLTQRQALAAVKMLVKYQRQLGTMGITVDDLNGGIGQFEVPVEPTVQEKPKQYLNVSMKGEMVLVKFGAEDEALFRDTLQAIKSLEFRRFDGADKAWQIKPGEAATLAGLLEPLGYDVTKLRQISVPDVQPQANGQVDQSNIRVPQELVSTITQKYPWLYPHQKVGVSWLMVREKCILGDEMGLGKTVETIVALHEKYPTGRLLVICPASLKMNWMREINRIEPDATIQIIGMARPRLWPKIRKRDNLTVDVGFLTKQEMFDYFCRWTICNYDQLKKWEPILKKKVFQATSVDEGHMIANPSAQRTMATLRLVGRPIGKDVKEIKEGKLKPFPGPESLTIMTGTPIKNKVRDLFTLLWAIDHPLARRGYYSFCHTFTNARNNGFGWEFNGVNWENFPKLMQGLEGYMLQRLADDVLKDLPEFTRQWLDVEGNMRDYQKYEREVIERLRAAGIHEVNDENYGRVRGLTIDLMTKMRVECAQMKVPHAIEMAQNTVDQGQKVIIFTCYDDTRRSYVDHFGKAAVTVWGGMSPAAKDAAVASFQKEDEVKVIVCNIIAGGVGLNMTMGRHVITADLDWVPANHKQAEKRLHRIGQHYPTLGTYLLASGTIDEHVKGTFNAKLKLVTALEAGARQHAANADAEATGEVGSALAAALGNEDEEREMTMSALNGLLGRSG